MNISGGAIGEDFDAFDGSVVNVSGGALSNTFEAFDGSAVNFFGSQFFIDGVELDSLQPGQALTITDRDVMLSGVLDSGEQFNYVLHLFRDPDRGFFDIGATVTVTLGSPGAILLCDVNQDGLLNFLDIAPFIEILAANTFLPQADCNLDGAVNFLDIAPFIAILAN